MTEPDLPADVQQLIDVPRYGTDAELPVEAGAIRLLCGAVENPDARCWSDDDPVAPASSLTMWTKPLPWSPGADPVPPLRTHEELKDRFALPLAVMSGCSMVFHAPIRAGDRLRSHEVLRSVSAPKVTALGRGRFWTIDVEVRRGDELVGVETSTAFAYDAEPA